MAKKNTLKTKTKIWDAAEHLQDEEDIATYLQVAFEDGDPSNKKNSDALIDFS